MFISIFIHCLKLLSIKHARNQIYISLISFLPSKNCTYYEINELTPFYQGLNIIVDIAALSMQIDRREASNIATVKPTIKCHVGKESLPNTQKLIQNGIHEWHYSWAISGDEFKCILIYGWMPVYLIYSKKYKMEHLLTRENNSEYLSMPLDKELTS